MCITKEERAEAYLYFRNFVWPMVAAHQGLSPDSEPKEADFQAFLNDTKHLFPLHEKEEDKRWEKL